MRRNLMRPVPRALVLASAVAAAATAPATGQTTVLLRYHPVVGTRLGTTTEMDVTQTFVGLPSVPDSETATVNMRLGVSQRVMSGGAGSYRVRVAIDSVRARGRVGQGAWKDMPASRLDGANTDLIVDSLLGLTRVRGAAADSAAESVVANYRAYAIPLPAEPVAAGSQWSAEVPFALGDFTPSSVTGMGAAPQRLVTHLLARADSVVPRGADTLAYVTVSGTFDPVSQSISDSTGSGTISVRGGTAAVQIWSTAWNGWVSASTRSRVELKLHGTNPTGSVLDATVMVEMNGRMRVQP